MSVEKFLQWQWKGYSAAHRNRTNLLIHIVAVPLFMAATLLAVYALVRFSLPAPRLLSWFRSSSRGVGTSWKRRLTFTHSRRRGLPASEPASHRSDASPRFASSARIRFESARELYSIGDLLKARDHAVAHCPDVGETRLEDFAGGFRLCRICANSDDVIA